MAWWRAIFGNGSLLLEVEGECVLGITLLWSVSLSLPPVPAANQIYSLETTSGLHLHKLHNYDCWWRGHWTNRRYDCCSGWGQVDFELQSCPHKLNSLRSSEMTSSLRMLRSKSWVGSVGCTVMQSPSNVASQQSVLVSAQNAAHAVCSINKRSFFLPTNRHGNHYFSQILTHRNKRHNSRWCGLSRSQLITRGATCCRAINDFNRHDHRMARPHCPCTR